MNISNQGTSLESISETGTLTCNAASADFPVKDPLKEGIIVREEYLDLQYSTSGLPCRRHTKRGYYR